MESLKNIVLLFFLLLLLANCRDPEPEPLEAPPTIVVGGQNPLKTGIYMSFVDDSVTAYSRYGIETFYLGDSTAVDTSLLGYYQMVYHAVSLSGMTTEAEREVWVVVKPESMKGMWDVAFDSLSFAPPSPFEDSLGVENKKLIINNLHHIPKLKVVLSLASNLQDSVYIFEQYLLDSSYCVSGVGTIDERAMKMKLSYSIVKDSITTKWEATYSRKEILTK